MNFQYETAKTRERELKAYKEAFDYYDWNKSGTISIKVGLNIVEEYDTIKFPIKICSTYIIPSIFAYISVFLILHKSVDGLSLDLVS